VTSAIVFVASTLSDVEVILKGLSRLSPYVEQLPIANGVTVFVMELYEAEFGDDPSPIESEEELPLKRKRSVGSDDAVEDFEGKGGDGDVEAGEDVGIADSELA
jgi:hypothetical protein